MFYRTCFYTIDSWNLNLNFLRLLIGGRHPEGGPSRRDHRVAQEDPGGHVHAPVPCRATGKHGLPAVGLVGPEGRHGHHVPPP